MDKNNTIRKTVPTNKTKLHEKSQNFILLSSNYLKQFGSGETMTNIEISRPNAAVKAYLYHFQRRLDY
jgi:hypothetical protein